jgi:primosomal protein N' (replication factor Y)
MAAVTGPAAAVGQLLAEAILPAGAEVLGPVELAAAGPGPGGQPGVRALVRVPRAEALPLAAALRAALALRSARKDNGQVRVQIDPADMA